MMRCIPRCNRFNRESLPYCIGDTFRFPLSSLGDENVYPHRWSIESFTLDGLAIMRRMNDNIERIISIRWLDRYATDETRAEMRARKPEGPRETMAEFRARCPETAERIEGAEFYVSVQDNGRNGFLLGPYETHDEARQNVTRARKFARDVDSRAIWYAFGTCSAPVGLLGAGRFGR